MSFLFPHQIDNTVNYCFLINCEKETTNTFTYYGWEALHNNHKYSALLIYFPLSQ